LSSSLLAQPIKHSVFLSPAQQERFLVTIERFFYFYTKVKHYCHNCNHEKKNQH
jgi:hypothetical protein